MARNYSAAGMPQLNGNLLCAVDVETTGLDPKENDLIQLCVLPLDSHLKPLKTVTPFYMDMTPENLDAIDWQASKVHKVDMAKLILSSMDKYKAADLFEVWFEKLDLPLTANHHKKLMPLWSNGGFDKSFIIEWLGPSTYSHIFHFHERDTQTLALAINDRFYFHGEKLPFPKVGLNALAAKLGVVNENAHDALSDCITTAEVYRRLLTMWMPTNPGSIRVDSDDRVDDSDNPNP